MGALLTLRIVVNKLTIATVTYLKVDTEDKAYSWSHVDME